MRCAFQRCRRRKPERPGSGRISTALPSPIFWCSIFSDCPMPEITSLPHPLRPWSPSSTALVRRMTRTRFRDAGSSMSRLSDQGWSIGEDPGFSGRPVYRTERPDRPNPARSKPTRSNSCHSPHSGKDPMRMVGADHAGSCFCRRSSKSTPWHFQKCSRSMKTQFSASRLPMRL